MSNKNSNKVRYAVVALGHIAQKAILPAFEHTLKNSELVALVSGSPNKLVQLGKHYKVELSYDYADYEECLKSGFVDAVFIALPNDMHKEFAIKAAKAGIHILSEKPLAVTARDCQQIKDAADKNGVKLMTAYRLHNEFTNLTALEIVRSGKIGEPRYFHSVFSFKINDNTNYRLKKAKGGGTIYDIGVYCINAARHLFEAEPEEVVAFSARGNDPIFRDIDEMTSAIMRFPGERLASFTTSFGSADRDMFEIVGTKGTLQLEPAFEYEGELGYKLTMDGKTTEKKTSARDQFAAEILYFSDCILKGEEPEPSGLEGLADVRIVEALYKSARSKRIVKLPKFKKESRPSIKQEIHRPPVKNPKLVDVKPAAE